MRTIYSRAALAAGLLAAAVAGGCGQNPSTTGTAPNASSSVPGSAAPETNPAGDIPDNQVYVAFTSPDNLFTVSVPEGWARSTDGADTVFSDKFNSISIRTTVRADAPTADSAAAEELAPIAATAPGYIPGAVSTVQRGAGQAVLITYTATSTADPVTGKSVSEAVERYEFWRDGREVVLTLIGPRGADNVDPWRAVTDSLQWS
ncbi:hypothetical protein [Rhodococcus qingshengii]|uniref:hypothetical protein n=1 Tax=Rhodococcus qingshengii TaxID=334542 RepID=UPI0024B8EF76|nr:hypothetical protein [Rhodococcus qingshengii]MDJ0441408.1 hypothetical protein [Rhodococcus qingshengii]